jgi:poly-gamma-glutamate synthesis protein (capsule biosynthesis protein)
VVDAPETAVWSPDAAPAARWTLLPFPRLKPALKALRLGDQSPLDADFDAAAYPLTVAIGLSGDSEQVAQWRAAWPHATSNRDEARLTRVAMSGPSGLGRAVASRIEYHGVRHPGRHVAPVFDRVDIAHLSNEVPFAPDCPPEEQEAVGDRVFCAPDRYLELMTYLAEGPQILINEMSGNHGNDWGRENLRHTFSLYEEAGIRWFGGGRDETAAREPLLLTHNGNRLAFVGCNVWGPPKAWATDEEPGALKCEEDFGFLRSQIESLSERGYQVIATLQYVEYYRYDPPQRQQRDFRRLATAGAAVVSGSQAHHVQGMGFHGDAFIHYGVGNLIFDQMQMMGTRQSFIDIYTFYDNRLLNVELWTGLIEDYCCPRPMTAVERRQFLNTIFANSDWSR